MTRNESFKRRVRDRMERTGEKYGAARRVLIEQVSTGSREWVSAPEHPEESVRENTGRGWDEWCDLIDAWEGSDEGHTAVARFVGSHDGVNGWWAQAVTIGWERITGRRVPNQMSDGTFTANKSRTVDVDVDALRALLLDDDDRAELFPGMETEMRSRPTAKTLRVGVPEGRVQMAMAPKDDGRVTITTSHEKLDSPEAVTRWKGFWETWLAAVAEG